MLRDILMLFGISILAGVLGFTGLAGITGIMAQLLFATFLMLCLVAVCAVLLLGKAVM